MKIIYDSKGKKLKKPLNLTLKQLLKKDACMVLNNIPVISYNELKRPSYTRYLKSKLKMGDINTYQLLQAKKMFNWTNDEFIDFMKWVYEE